MNILDLREYRDNFEKDLAKDLNLITIRPNFPGEDKRNLYSNFVSMMGLFDFISYIKIERFYSSYSEEGLIFYLKSKDDVTRLKEKAIAVERWFQIGRLLDIDIRDESGQISRSNLAHAKRKCFICNKPAHICVRSKTHNRSEIEKFFKDEVVDFIYEGSKKEVFAKVFIFATSVEFYKYLELSEDNLWEIKSRDLEKDYLKTIYNTAKEFEENDLDLKDKRNCKHLEREFTNILKDFPFIEEEHIYILLNFYKSFIRNEKISFKSLFNKKIDILNIITISESMKKTKSYKEGLITLVALLIKDGDYFNLSDEDLKILSKLNEEKDEKQIRKFLYSRKDIFYYSYNISILSLILLFMENDKKEVMTFEY